LGGLAGRELLAAFDQLMQRMPFIKMIYGSARTLTASLQENSESSDRRVVLVDFPSPVLKAVGFVTRTFVDSQTGTAVGCSLHPDNTQPHLMLQ
jgi:uncharacterized membrane protein